jgi:chemotaxis protein methyltransferase CheR
MSALSIRASGFFRDAGFYRAFREKAVPLLRTYPFVRIWHAGCANGEEVYSLGIVMHEEGLLDKCDFYATDVNAAALEAGDSGVYRRNLISSSEQTYKDSGGKRSLSSYFDNDGRIDGSIKKHVSFMRHNLVTDGSFNEFNVIFCRNVLIYFSRPLQDRVHELLYSSLTHFGILGLGANETVKLTRREKHYRALDEANKLYRRID